MARTSFLDGLKRAQHVEHAMPLEAALAAEIGGALAEEALEPERLADQLGIAGHQHRRGAADVRRGHAGAVEVAPFAPRQGRTDTLAGRDEVRLHASVPGRPPAREEADPVRVRPETVRRADRDHTSRVS